MSLFDAIPALESHEREPVIMLVTVTVVYLAAHYGASKETFQRLLSRRFEPAMAQAGAVHLQRLVGGFLLGVLPLLVLIFGLDGCPYAHGFQAPNDWSSAALFVGIGSAILVPVIALNARSEAHQKLYPEIRFETWTSGRWLANLGSWVIYLVAYEFFVRGFMLFILVKSFGVWPGLMIMTAFYVAIHLPKGAGEAIGCLPMGLVFGLSAILLESVFPAVLLHAIISNSNATFSIRANPKMRFGAA